MGRRKDAKKEAKKAAHDAKDRAIEIRDQAKEVAGQSGEALKEFASKTKDAAKELVDSIEKAAKNASVVEEQKKGRKVLKATLAIGAGVAVLTNEKARETIKSVISRSKASGDQPEVWRPDARPTVNGGSSASTTAAGIAEETS
jgi:hypothetical protein